MIRRKKKIRITLIIAFLVQNRLDWDVKHCVLVEIQCIKQSKRIINVQLYSYFCDIIVIINAQWTNLCHTHRSQKVQQLYLKNNKKVLLYNPLPSSCESS